jgi:hypothetical protein
MAMSRNPRSKSTAAEPASAPASPSDFFGPNEKDVAALMAASTALTDGLERIGREWIGLTRESLTYTAATGIALLDAASIADVAALAGSFASGVVERSTAVAARMIELSLAVAGNVSAPLAIRLEDAPDDAGSAPAP